MSRCPSSEELFRQVDGDLATEEAATITAHLQTCARCRAEVDELHQLTGALRIPVQEGMGGEEFVAATMQRIVAEGSAEATRPTPGERPTLGERLRRWLELPQLRLAAVAALLLLVALPLLPRWIDRPGQSDRGQPQGGHFTARGDRQGPSLAREVGLHAFLWRDGISRELEPAAPAHRDETLGPADRLSVAYSHLGEGQLYLMAFAVDARGEVHWLHPAYRDPGEDPEAVPLRPGARREPLADAVSPEQVAPGPLRLVLLASPQRYRVRAIEQRLSAAGLKGGSARSPSTLFPGDRVEEWALRAVNR